MRVLIVEDELKMASLSGAGWPRRATRPTSRRPATTRSGWREAHPYDAIVLDVMLPGATASRRAARCARPGSGRPC